MTDQTPITRILGKPEADLIAYYRSRLEHHCVQPGSSANRARNRAAADLWQYTGVDAKSFNNSDRAQFGNFCQRVQKDTPAYLALKASPRSYTRNLPSRQPAPIPAVTPPPSANGHPTLFPIDQAAAPRFASAVDFTIWMFTRWVERAKPQPQDVFTFSPRQYADCYELLTGESRDPGSFVNPFLASQVSHKRLSHDGWAFEPVKGSTHETYHVRIVAVPAPAPALPDALAGLTPEQLRALGRWITANVGN